MANGKLIKVLGIVTTLGGLGLGWISDWVDEQKSKKQMEEVANKVYDERQKES